MRLSVSCSCSRLSKHKSYVSRGAAIVRSIPRVTPPRVAEPHGPWQAPRHRKTAESGDSAVLASRPGFDGRATPLLGLSRGRPWRRGGGLLLCAHFLRMEL